MKLLSLVLCALLPLCAAASPPRQYKVAMKYYRDGKLVSSPTVVVNEGKQAEIAEGDGAGHAGHFLAVTPTRWTKKGSDSQVRLSLVVGKIVEGKRIELGRPEIVALEKEPASIELGERDRDGHLLGSYKVSALVTRE